MAKYMIKSARYGGGDVGMGEGPTVAETEFLLSDGTTFFLGLAEVFGVANFIKTDNSAFDFLMNTDASEEEINAYSPYFLGIEYDDVFENPEDEFCDLYRYLIYLVRAEEDDANAYIAETVGKYLDELDVPASDVEEDYMEMAEPDDV